MSILMSGTSEALGSVDHALAEVERLLTLQPRLAAEKAAAILAEAPGHPTATLFLGIALRFAGDGAESARALEPLVQSRPDWATAHYELGRAHEAAGQAAASIAALRRALELQPNLPGAWCSLAGQLRKAGDEAGADAVCTARLRLAARDPGLADAQAAMDGGRLTAAEGLLRTRLRADPTDPAAIRMLAEIALKLRQVADAEKLLKRCLELAPNFSVARYQYAVALHLLGRYAEARPEIERALASEPRNPAFRNVQALLLERVGEVERAIGVYADLLAEHPQQPRTWLNYGHALTAAGRQADAITAYRKCIELLPGLGEAWWSLANLKTFRFTGADIGEMGRQLDRRDLSDEDRVHFEFALGRALEVAGDPADSFRHYQAANRLHRSKFRYDAAEVTAHVRRSREVLTPRIFAERTGQGSPAPDPIFIVGLPRAGSTLLEQILASHSAVEGTSELPDLIAIVRDLAERGGHPGGTEYLGILAGLAPEELRALGERYLASTRLWRRTDAPYFVDKMPNNFAHVGLIQLILPNARIIDARRHPLACCWSNFKQLFARGQYFTYDLEEIGRYYRDYVEVMAHFDAVLPGRVHRVCYERLVEDPETEVRQLLSHCGLPFEERCLRFHETDRAVRSASSGQVRMPLYTDGVHDWRKFEAWLEPLKKALGPVLEAYPGVPPFAAP
jgi:tetratricopeptide (TPR) repeat protein